jgi:hypothetical protein
MGPIPPGRGVMQAVRPAATGSRSPGGEAVFAEGYGARFTPASITTAPGFTMPGRNRTPVPGRVCKIS